MPLSDWRRCMTVPYKTKEVLGRATRPTVNMKWLLVFTVAFAVPSAFAFIQWIEPRYPLPGIRSAPGSPWPLPQEWENCTRQFTLDPSTFDLKHNVGGCDVLDQAVVRYRRYVFAEVLRGRTEPSLPKLEGLDIQVEGKCEQFPNPDTDESYNINLEKTFTRAQLKAKTIWGALRALETFSQLVYQLQDGSYVINVTRINDYPRFKYRGFLLDTARHYVPISVIKKNLDAMAWNKFNLFHWHLVDDQSYPFESKVYPNLTIRGAYSPKHVYTQATVQEIIEYARLRGIRVLPEIDSPGHTHAFGKTFPHLITPCYGDGVHPFTPNFTEFSESEILNPMLEETYQVMKNIIRELQNVFKDPYVHLGMDEVYYGCWTSSPEIKKFMQEKGFTKISQVEQYYVERLIKEVADLGYKYMAWQDPIENGVTFAPDTIVHVWKDTELDHKMDTWQNYTKLVAKGKYDIVISACWYLNYISYGQDWKKYYHCDPQDFEGTDAEKNLVIGGQASMWMEYADGTNLLSRLWPRASAVAERLWSAKSVKDVDSAAFRLDEHRCRMLKRGIPASPILNGFCGDYEWEMNSN